MITKEYLQQELVKRIDGYKRGVETTTDNIIAEMKSILVLVDALPDYEKKYNKALERFRAFKEKYYTKNTVIGDAIFDKTGEMQRDFESIFSELRESEDERIRKALIDMVKRETGFTGFPSQGQVLAWLERQKEQKPAEKQDYSGLTDLERAIHRGFLVAGVENVPVTIIKETAKECLAQQKPAEWSEEDKLTVDSAIFWLKRRLLSEKAEDISTYSCPLSMRKTIERLESFRPSWKPSEEQMEVLLNAEGLVRANNYNENAKILASLYEDLKRL